MSYKSRSSRTEIKRGKQEYLGLSIQKLGQEQWASLFVTVPYRDLYVNHHHFEISRDEAEAMYDWFKSYLKDKRFKTKKVKPNKSKKVLGKK